MADYRVQNHKIEFKDPTDNQYYPYCEEIEVTKVVIDLLTQRRWVEIMIYTDPDPVTFRIERDSLNRSVLPKLLRYGLTVVDNKDQVDFILEVLLNSEASAARVYEHDRLGFQMVGDEQVFLAHHPIGSSSPSKALSEYCNPEKTKPCGTLDSWKQVIQEEVIGHENMELALALSATAPVAHLLLEARHISLVPIWALIGKSSTGKTTALKMMASLWGSPDESKGIISDLNVTQNAFFAQLSNNCAIPALIDETSSVPEWDFGKVIYNLPKGKDKLRCDSGGKIREPVHYSGAIILTGETSLFSQTNGNQGLYARMVEFSLPWTEDEHHAQRLELGCKCNHGTAVYPLMNWLMSSKAILPDTYWQLYKNLKEARPDTPGVEDRLLKMYAIILLAAKVVRTALGLPMNIQAMQRVLLNLHEDNWRANHSPGAVFEKVKRQILENYAKFPAQDPFTNAKTVWGGQGYYGDKPVFWISCTIFETFVRNAGAPDVDAIRPVFFRNGWMVRTSDRHYQLERTLGGVRVNCYGLYIS